MIKPLSSGIGSLTLSQEAEGIPAPTPLPSVTAGGRCSPCSVACLYGKIDGVLWGKMLSSTEWRRVSCEGVHPASHLAS
jgi:hypothetical protein